MHDLEDDLVQVEVLVNQQSSNPWLNCVIMKLRCKKVRTQEWAPPYSQHVARWKVSRSGEKMSERNLWFSCHADVAATQSSSLCQVPICVSIYIYVYVYIYIYVFMICIYILCIYKYIYISIYIRISLHACTYIDIPSKEV